MEQLKEQRNQACASASGFSLQPQQKFLRRIMSPDSPARSVLLVHGTGTGKTCTAIQIAEEYILRPEFQDSKVLVIASSPVQDNFRKQLFDMDRVQIDTTAGILESKQCTGRRYLEMLQRIESEPKNWKDPEVRDRLQKTADKLINEFYEFNSYEAFGNFVNSLVGVTEKDIDAMKIHEMFDNRLVIIDEAHRIKESDTGSVKGSTRGIENLVKIAKNMVLVLMTATPMFDVYEEIFLFLNLFLWNDRRQGPKEFLKASDFFNADATLKAGPAGERFRTLCQDYVSFVKGENPLTFPFRLPPPRVAPNNLTKTFLGDAMTDRLRYITVVDSEAQGLQKDILTKSERTDTEEKRRVLMQDTVAVLPKPFRELFRQEGGQYAGPALLTPEELPKVSAKFVSVLQSIENSVGIVLVYSNFVTMGTNLFAMALEEHGYTNASGSSLLKTPSYTGKSKGKYILLTSELSDRDMSSILAKVKAPNNRDGKQIRVIVSGPVVSEGVDFRYVRQIHILDPWWNMSRIEQVIGRGLRTCSHAALPFEDQNCTVYLHVVRTGDGKECFDEYTYRTRVEPKALRIARVRRVLAESAMDCPMQVNLSEDLRNLEVPQRASEGNELKTYKLSGMMAPTFDEDPSDAQCAFPLKPEDPVRPLSAYLDVRDELLTKLGERLIDKPIWDREELLVALRPYNPEVVLYNLQQAVQSGFRFKDAFGRPAVLESKGDLYALSAIGVPNQTVIERTTRPPAKGSVPLPTAAEEEDAPSVEIAPDLLSMKRDAFPWPADAKTRFDEKVLNGYVFDHLFTPEEKRAYLKTRPDTLPFADRLYVPDTDVIVLGHNVFDPPGIPIGTTGASFRAWNAKLLAKFIEQKNTIFASLTDKMEFTYSKLVLEGDTVKRKTGKQKRYEPVKCGTGKHEPETLVPSEVLQRFAKFIDAKGVGLPMKKGVDAMCLYAELLAREEHNCMWVTPEELSVLYDDSDNKAAFTTALKQ